MQMSNIFQSPAFTLEWSFNLDDDPMKEGAVARLRYQFTARQELFVSDRLWDYTRDARRVPDTFGVYRFLHQSTLRLLLWPAPQPRNIRLLEVYTPLFSRVLAGSIHRGERQLALPVDEYSSLARDVGSPTEITAARRIEIVVGVRLRSELKADPKPPLNESAEEAGFVVLGARQFASAIETPPIPVRRRLGDIPRPVLPGDEVAT